MHVQMLTFLTLTVNQQAEDWRAHNYWHWFTLRPVKSSLSPVGLNGCGVEQILYIIRHQELDEIPTSLREEFLLFSRIVW